jgi:hypothetical protein
MREPQITFKPETGEFVLRSLEPPLARVRQELPNFLRLAREHPRARKRLLPQAYDNADADREWQRHAAPEIAHLLGSASELVVKDLATLQKEGFSRTWRVVFPEKHRAAWMTSLNAARLAIAEVYRIGEAEMQGGRGFDPGSERDVAVVNIHLLGWIQELVVQTSA